MILLTLLFASLVAGTTPFAPLPAALLESPELRQLLEAGDLVVARPASDNGRRVFTGLALAHRPCAQVHQLIANPTTYPLLYPLVERVEVKRKGGARTVFSMKINAGAASTTRQLTMTALDGQVLDTMQEAGHSTWHFFAVGEDACILHYTHDEQLTAESLVLRLALSNKGEIVEGIQAASAAGNVRNVRAYLEKDRRSNPLPETAVGQALARLAEVGTAAFLAYQPGSGVRVAARAGDSVERALRAARESERWGSFIEPLAGRLLSVRTDGKRRMGYTLDSLSEKVDFETWQTANDALIREEICGGELTSGGWVWRAVADARGVALLLEMRLQIAEGDWLVGKVLSGDRAAEEGTLLGFAFMLVESVAEHAQKRAR
ncbi:MAG: hypothetical protein JXR83_03125 [Deltaproteobacteria bacterium]|nr:hypothetical protein [Deltaproteobacteria bacterium]